MTCRLRLRIVVLICEKRSASSSIRPARAAGKPPAGNVDAEWTHDLYGSNNGNANIPRGPRAQRQNRNDRLHSALNASASSPSLHTQFNIVGTQKPRSSISIKGVAAAGPFMVVVKNLVQGTTVADVESAMTPVGGVVLSCRLIAERPKVIAELAFETKEGADNVVDTFNNQNVSDNKPDIYLLLICILQGRRQYSSSLPQNWTNPSSRPATIEYQACTDLIPTNQYPTRPSCRPWR